MTLRFRVLVQADQEVEHAAGHYEWENPGTGRRFLHDYFELLTHLRAFPRTGARLPEYDEPGLEIRAFVVSTTFPYTVFAAVSEDEIVIVAVAHQHQEPGYWTKRLDSVVP